MGSIPPAKKRLKSKRELNQIIQEMLDTPAPGHPCPSCGFVDKTVDIFKPRKMIILENLANRAASPDEKRADAFANALFEHGYDQKEIDPFSVLKLLVENADMPEQWKNALIAGISDNTELELEKPVQVVEWHNSLELTVDDFPVQLQNGEEMLVLRDQNEWEIFRKARTW